MKREGTKEKLYSKEGLGISEVCYKSKNYAFVENFFFDNSSPSGQILVRLVPLPMCLTPAIYTSCSCYFKCLGSDNASNYTTLVIVTFLLPPIYFVGYTSFRRHKRSSTKLYTTYFFNPFLQCGLLARNSYHFT